MVDEWLRKDVGLKATVAHERLVDEHGFTGSYQRVTEYVREARPVSPSSWRGRRSVVGAASPLRGGSRRAGQIEWGDEGAILAAAGIGKVYSFHMTSS